jgi:SAM-dependent methyltransferase
MSVTMQESGRDRRTWFFNTREKLLSREFGDRPFRVLDVGAGNDSPLKFKSLFPACEYSGIDRDTRYNLGDESVRLMDRFYPMDLSRPEFGAIPDGHFDALVMSHVLEHLANGDEVVRGLIPKLRPGGVVYVEWPAPRSAKLPHMRGTLNFHDDATHVRIYSRSAIADLLRACGCLVLKSGVRRNWLRVALLPAILVRNYRSRGHLEGSDFWELLGFADYAFARKEIAL